jgi:hypothetical protein
MTIKANKSDTEACQYTDMASGHPAHMDFTHLTLQFSYLPEHLLRCSKKCAGWLGIINPFWG